MLQDEGESLYSITFHIAPYTGSIYFALYTRSRYRLFIILPKQSTIRYIFLYIEVVERKTNGLEKYSQFRLQGTVIPDADQIKMLYVALSLFC